VLYPHRSVRHCWFTLVLGLSLFALSIYSLNFLPKGFIPAGDEARLLISVELPPGSRLADTAAVTDAISVRFKRRCEVARVFVLGGQLIGNSGKEIRKAALIVNLVHKSQRQRTQKQIESDLTQDLSEISGIRFWFVQGNGQRGLSLIVSGSDPANIAQVAAQMQSEMKRLPLIANPISTASLNRPEIQIRPNWSTPLDLA
jgi:multidrug efflux pump subunit AcrB